MLKFHFLPGECICTPVEKPFPLFVDSGGFAVKSFVLVSALAFLHTVALSTSAVAQPRDDKSAADEKAILAAERDFLDANKTSDTGALQRLLREDYIGIDANGGIQSKVEALKAMDAATSGPKKAPAAAVSAMNAIRIRYYGDVALLTAGAMVGGPKGSSIRYTHVWIKAKDQWQLTNAQITRVSATKP